MKTYLERIDPDAGMARFYIVMLQPTLFGEWTVTREWGRIGQGGTLRHMTFRARDAAVEAADRVVSAKQHRGYASRVCDHM